jgi:hypothetical protein
MTQEEVPPIDPEKITITLEKKTILKFYIRLYFFLNHKLRQLNERVNSSGKFGFSKQQKKTILEQYFDEDINNINKLSNSADMFLVKPYFEHLCNNSYDDDCNEYRKYLNYNKKNLDDQPDELSNLIIEQVKDYADKFDSLSLNNQLIENIKKKLDDSKVKFGKKDFEKISEGIIAFLKENSTQEQQDYYKQLSETFTQTRLEYDRQIETLKKDLEEYDYDTKKKYIGQMPEATKEEKNKKKQKLEELESKKEFMKKKKDEITIKLDKIKESKKKDMDELYEKFINKAEEIIKNPDSENIVILLEKFFSILDASKKKELLQELDSNPISQGGGSSDDIGLLDKLIEKTKELFNKLGEEEKNSCIKTLELMLKKEGAEEVAVAKAAVEAAAAKKAEEAAAKKAEEAAAKKAEEAAAKKAEEAAEQAAVANAAEDISSVTDEQKKKIETLHINKFFEYLKKIPSNKPQSGGILEPVTGLSLLLTIFKFTPLVTAAAATGAAIKSGIGGVIVGFGLAASVLSHNNKWTAISEAQTSEKSLNIVQLTTLDHILRDIYDNTCAKIVDDVDREEYLKKVKSMTDVPQIEETWHQITCIVNNLNNNENINDDLLYEKLPAISLNLSSLPSFKNNLPNLKKVIQLIILKLHLNHQATISEKYDDKKFIESYVKPIKDNIKDSFTNGFEQYLEKPDQTLENNENTKTHIYRGLNKQNIAERLVRFFTYKYIKPVQENFDYCIAFFKFLKNNEYNLFNEVKIIEIAKLNEILLKKSSNFEVLENFENDLNKRLNEILYDKIDELEKKITQADVTLNSSTQAGELVIMMKSTHGMKLGLVFMSPDDEPSLRMEDGTVKCVIKETKPGTKFYNFFNKGDQIIAINGTSCTDPMTAEKQLKELVGNFNVNVLRASPPSSAVHAKAAP